MTWRETEAALQYLAEMRIGAGMRQAADAERAREDAAFDRLRALAGVTNGDG